MNRHAVVMTLSLGLAACGGAGGGGNGTDAGGTAGQGGSPDGGAGPAEDRPPAPSPFTIVALDKAGIGSIGSTGWPQTGSAQADLDWRQGPFARVSLVVDLDSTCFPFEKWASNPPPAGQNWPADCDAFDCNFNVFLDDPPFEVIHAITPFGGPEHLEVDLTDLANARPGAHRLRVDLTSYPDAQGLVTGSNGGWTVSARVEVTPGEPPRHVLAAIPLFLGGVSHADLLPAVAWTVPEGTTSARLEYRTSGHGQGTKDARCLGPAEEFCDRRHLVFIDDTMIDNIEPWRQDCATLCTVAHYGPADAGFDYCQENPCGALDSVRASRANWCPGSMTPPFVWQDLPALIAPGPHTFSFQITSIGEGGSWQVSAIYYAFGS